VGREERGGAVVFDTITAEGGAVCTSRKDLVGTMDRLARVARDSHAPLAPPTLYIRILGFHSFIHLEFRKLSLQILL
jgi:hypothetical protein